jgi:hypothetical protein
MIIDAVLLTVGNIVHDAHPNLRVAILPETRLESIDWKLRHGGIQVKNPESGYELLLNGTMDYAVLRYKGCSDIKGRYLVVL